MFDPNANYGCGSIDNKIFFIFSAKLSPLFIFAVRIAIIIIIGFSIVFVVNVNVDFALVILFDRIMKFKLINVWYWSWPSGERSLSATRSK